MKNTIIILLFVLGQSSFAQDVCITPLEKQVLQAINNFRKEKGLNELKISKILMLTANKNAETMANQTYTDFKVTQFGNYTGRTQRIKMATSVTTQQQIVSTLTAPSEYNKNAKMLGNTDEFAQFKWKSIGIALRKSNDASVPMVICVYVGESEEEIISPKECKQEEIYFSQNVKPQPDRVEVVQPKEKDWKYVKVNVSSQRERVSWYLHGLNASNKTNKIINNLYFDRKADSIRHQRYNDSPNYAVGSIQLNPDNTEYDSYEIYYYTKPSPIVPQEFIFRISREELKKSPKDIWYNLDYQKGNTLAELKAYIDKDPKNLYLQDYPYKYAVLHRAIQQDNLECVAYLLNEKSVSVNLRAEYDMPMNFCRSDAMFDLLMSKKPNLNFVDNTNTTVLHSLAANNVLKGVKYMVEVHKANIHALDRQKGTPLHSALRYPENYEVIKYLLSKGAKQTQGWGRYPIHYAIENHDVKMLKLLLDNGGKAHLNLLSEDGNKALYLVLMSGNMAMIQLLVDSGINLNELDNRSKKRIVDVYKGHVDAKPEVIEYLKSKGVKF